MPKSQGVLVGLVLMVGVWLLMLALPWLSPKKFEIDTFRPTFNYMIVVLVAMFAFIEIVALQQVMVPRILIGGLMLFLAAIGNLLGKVRRNFYVGVRTPWTLASESNWVATHRLAARLMVGAGVLGAILVFAGVPTMPVFVLFIAAILYPVLYSFLLYKRTEGKGMAIVVVLLFGLAAHANAEGREVEFKGIDGMTLKGTLLLPDGKGKFPAMVLLPGSGPTDRNGNQPGMTVDLLKQIAEELAKDGIATLRFDKRAVGTVYKDVYPKDLAKFNDFFSWENHVGDARKAFDYLRSQPEIDTKHVGILGHSEGSMIAMAVAGQDDGPALAVLVGAPGRPLGTVMHEQIVASLARNPAPGIDSEKLIGEFDATLKSIVDKSVLPSDMDPLLAPLFPPIATKYLHSVFLFQPTEVAAKIKCPVFVVQGEKDIQISVLRDTPPLMEALKKRPGYASELLVVPSASHNLKAVQDEKKEPGFAGPVVPLALKSIGDWVKKTFEK